VVRKLPGRFFLSPSRSSAPARQPPMRRAAPRRRPLPTATLTPPQVANWFPRAMRYLPDQTRGQTVAGSARSRDFGEVRPRAAAREPTGVIPPPLEPAPASSPSGQDPTARFMSNPGSIALDTIQPRCLCKIALKFFQIQPALHLSSKVIAFQSFFLCLGPCSFSKSNPQSNIPWFCVLTPLSRV
jgi:hypothetical protein